ncbi:transposase [Escherichia coli]|nr:hypothetical protein CP48_p00610 [Escherichia coli]BDI44460.1 hypothetical protein EsCd1HHP024_05687 [Escherichia sp. HH091_1A]GDJ61345.1 transposase [Escherichia coli]GDK07095.1 transposase [Escherichia coli]
MPVDFLTSDQKQNYGCYAAVQLARYFHLDERDLPFINQRRGKHNRLGIALQLTTAHFLGTFLTDLTQVLPGVQHFVAVQLNIRRPEVLSRYAELDTTLREHTALIKEYYGYHEFGDFPWSFRLKRLLYTRAWLSNERPGLMFDCKRLARTVLIFTERSDQLSRATDRVPGLPASPGYAQ